MACGLLLTLGCLGLLFVLKIGYAAATIVVLPATRGALYVSSSRARIAAILDAVTLSPGQQLVDLGCGDGRVLRMARRRYGVRAVDYELNPLAWGRAKLQSLGRRNLVVCRRDFRRADLSEADVVFCYLFPDVMPEVAVKCRRELKPGALLICCNFPLPGCIAEQVLVPPASGLADPVFFYRAPWGQPGASNRGPGRVHGGLMV